MLIPLATACLEESSDALDQKAFTKIYDNSEFNASFYAIDIKQTADGGYLILGAKTKVVVIDDTPNVNTPQSVYLLKTDKYGNFVSELELEEPYLYPVGKLNLIGGNYYFFCMDAGTNAFLVNVTDQAEVTSITGLPLTLPLAASANSSGGLLLLSYDNEGHESVVSRITTTGTLAGNPIRFYTGTDSPVDDLVLNHANKEGKQFPFDVGQLPSGLYYFNGFINYTFSLVFTDLSDNNEYQGIVNGHQENAGMSMMLPITGSTFALSTFSFGFNFFSPSSALNLSGVTSVNNLQEDSYSFPELEKNARVKAIRTVINNKNVIVYASNTKSKQIGLYFYDETSGEFLNSKYVGYSNPFEIASVIQTTEGDLVVSGTTYISGRLPRFCLIKLSKSSLKGI